MDYYRPGLLHPGCLLIQINEKLWESLISMVDYLESEAFQLSGHQYWYCELKGQWPQGCLFTHPCARYWSDLISSPCQPRASCYRNMHGGRRDRGQGSEHSRTPTWLPFLRTSALLLFSHFSSVVCPTVFMLDDFHCSGPHILLSHHICNHKWFHFIVPSEWHLK